MSGSEYSLDTNSILTAWNNNYRPKNFGGFWERLELMIQDGRALICDEVYRELTAKDDGVAEWVKEQSGFVVELEEEQVLLARKLATEYPVLAKERLGRKRADGFVIALAQWKGLTVVTHENLRGTEKIPHICDGVNVPCITTADLIENEGWSFT